MVVRWLAGMSNGCHTSVGAGCEKPSGMTPMIVVGTPSIVMTFPTTDESRENALVQSVWLMMMTGAGEGPSSSTVNGRPSMGDTLVVLKNVADARVFWRARTSVPWLQLTMF